MTTQTVSETIVSGSANVRVSNTQEALQVVWFNKLQRAKQRKEEAERDIANANEALWELFGGLKGKHAIPGGLGEVTFSDNNVFDGEAFMAMLKPGQQQRVTTRTLDRAKAKAAYPDLWESVKSYRGYRTASKAY